MGVHIFWFAVLKKYIFFNHGDSPFSCHFVVNSAGINSSPDSSYFVHHHTDKYLCGESANFFVIFCRPEEFPFILLPNLSAAEVI